MSKKKSKKPVGFLLERTTRLVKLNFHKSFKTLGIDMTPEQWVVMDSLYQKNNQSQKDLGDTSFKNAATISRILDVLEKKKWISRKTSKEDRRVFVISQTSKGKSIVEKVQGEVNRLRELGWNGLSQEDYKNFTRIIDQIFKNYTEDQ